MPKHRVPVAEKNPDRKKETSQISVRVAQDLYDALYAYARTETIPVTDLVERGIQLLLAERDHEPDAAQRPRHVFWKQTPREARQAMLFTLTWYSELDAGEKMIHSFVCDWLQHFGNQPGRVSEAYERFRKSTDRLTTVSGKDRRKGRKTPTE